MHYQSPKRRGWLLHPLERSRPNQECNRGSCMLCGHDVHMTSLIGVSRLLSQNKDRWSGTVMLVGQPAEERGSGAKEMLQDELFTRFPKPSAAIALHCESATPAGTVALKKGYLLANVDSVDITVRDEVVMVLLRIRQSIPLSKHPNWCLVFRRLSVVKSNQPNQPSLRLARFMAVASTISSVTNAICR